MRQEREASWEEGREEGIEEGIKKGKQTAAHLTAPNAACNGKGFSAGSVFAVSARLQPRKIRSCFKINKTVII